MNLIDIRVSNPVIRIANYPDNLTNFRYPSNRIFFYVNIRIKIIRTNSWYSFSIVSHKVIHIVSHRKAKKRKKRFTKICNWDVEPIFTSHGESSSQQQCTWRLAQCLQQRCCFAHPSVTKLTRKIQQEQHSTQLQRRQLELGTITGKKKKTYVRINEALHTMVDGYNNRDPITYLEDIAWVLYINFVWLGRLSYL